MKATDLKNKVIERLIKSGNNPVDVIEMVSIHFERATENKKTVKEICEFIRILY
jgi:hypothetical protein